MERVKGIEPSCAAWEAAVLPLNYTRNGIFDFRLPMCDLQPAKITATKSRHQNSCKCPGSRPCPELGLSRTTKRSRLIAKQRVELCWRCHRRCRLCPNMDS